jgi:hypothetical protein
MPSRAAILIAAAMLVLAAGGCGGSSGESSTEAGAGAKPGTSAYVIGKWQGVLHQTGMPPFLVNAEVGSTTNPKKNTVSYSEIQCSGNWTYRGYSGGTYHFRELIDRGKGGSCKGAGDVTLVPEGADAVRYEFRGGGVVSRGTLNRKS